MGMEIKVSITSQDLNWFKVLLDNKDALKLVRQFELWGYWDKYTVIS